MTTPRGCDPDDRQASDRGGRVQAANRFPRDCTDAHKEKNGVGQRGEDGGAAQTVGEAFRRTAAFETERAPGNEQAHYVTQVVARVGEKSEGIAEQPENDFRYDETGIEEHANGKGASKIDFVAMRMAHRSNETGGSRNGMVHLAASRDADGISLKFSIRKV